MQLKLSVRFSFIDFFTLLHFYGNSLKGHDPTPDKRREIIPVCPSLAPSEANYKLTRTIRSQFKKKKNYEDCIFFPVIKILPLILDLKYELMEIFSLNDIKII